MTVVVLTRIWSVSALPSLAANLAETAAATGRFNRLLAAAEAAGHGLPVIASNASALPEAVAGARHRLVPPGDIAALADALRSLLSARSVAGARWNPPVDPRPRSWASAGQDFVAALDELAGR